MEFENWDAAKYRTLDLDAFNERVAYVRGLLEDEACEVETDMLVREAKAIEDERKRREAHAQMRKANMAAVASGMGKLVESSKAEPADEETSWTGTKEYERAFWKYVTRRGPRPAMTRADGDPIALTGVYTASTDVPLQIPDTMQQQVIKRMEERGGIYAKVSKSSLKGGIWFRVRDMTVTAQWIDEDHVTPYQKATDDTKISFTYHELECRIAQTLLMGAVTFDDFKRDFVQKVADAMVDALEAAIIAGSGDGQPLGIINDERIENVVEMTLEDIQDWKQWHRKVKASMPRLYRNGTFIMGQGTWDKYIETLHDDVDRPVSNSGYNPVTGEEQYRLMGKGVDTVDDSIIPDFDSADVGDVFAIFGNLSDYLLNTQPEMPLSTVRWIDHETNEEKTKALMACDGRVLDPYGFILVKKKASI